MSRVLRREAAGRDLVEQFTWYPDNASGEVADRFLASTEKTLSGFAIAPESGAPVAVARQELKGLGRWPVRGFEKVLSIYFPLPDGIDLVRVHQGSRDLETLFSGATQG